MALVGLTAASVIEAKTHASGNLIAATGQAAGDALDEASVAAQGAAAAAEAALVMQYQSIQDVIRAAKQALNKLGNTLKNLKVVPISTTLMPNVASHISRAQSMGKPGYLTRVAAPQARINRRLAIGKLGSAGLNKSWDEYPFASSLQGGIGASVAPVPTTENLIQGGVIGICYQLEKINPGDNFFVVVIP
jgi:hypothetical protein